MVAPIHDKPRPPRAFFGRREGHALRPQQAALFEALLPRLALDLDAAAPHNLATLFAPDIEAVRLEIGFGGGEHLIAEGERAPQTGFIGVEPFVNGMAKMMTALENRPLANLKVYDDDATRLLDWLPPASLDGIDLLYPDPWPKKKHWKRRFVSPANLDRFARVLKAGGKFCFASDIEGFTAIVKP